LLPSPHGTDGSGPGERGSAADGSCVRAVEVGGHDGDEVRAILLIQEFTVLEA